MPQAENIKRSPLAEYRAGPPFPPSYPRRPTLTCSNTTSGSMMYSREGVPMFTSIRMRVFQVDRNRVMRSTLPRGSDALETRHRCGA